ncbi:NADH dehydrogenase subunit 4L (mitochondrion) [Heteronotia binoei]|uniref:NADH-ubiquinone oxidoreductase chain 4L n=1 Tax=Heteronotia binoei TaxID=13085 RepID=A9XSE4_9SAUR|nr:NADH dehydrogenase subunit 4L [Heteronotia binoei]ABR21247.1 NADH dehydrogenase subunit 4L [Heteronotia binoei]ABR21260.1 NADH dehydrogenase subunit 4L [Heteronotia binoei]ABR21273.1 NADH dehydrogenase subunit 4L [Heteronotia binoei]ABR21286.1 NADH dehydrogenase subunit 4L [Heteronotia binoei]ABR21299.1 NADH dehydrogenase subunit 4L [Heteronotia binoei]
MTITHFTPIMTFTLCTAGLALSRKHLVSSLLCIEGMMLALFTSLATISQTLNHTTITTQPIILLAFAACGASTGLALLVATTRTHASDHLKALNLLKC